MKFNSLTTGFGYIVIPNSPNETFLLDNVPSTVVSNIPGVKNFNQDYSLKLKTFDGKYMVSFCTDPNDSENIKIKYIFDVKKLTESGSSTAVSYIQFDPTSSCSEDFLSALIPISENIYRHLLVCPGPE